MDTSAAVLLHFILLVLTHPFAVQVEPNYFFFGGGGGDVSTVALILLDISSVHFTHVSLVSRMESHARKLLTCCCMLSSG